MIWNMWWMWWCWMTWFRKGECSRLPAQHKKMTFDQASVCVQWEYRECKYQKMSEVSGLAYRFSGVQSSSQEQSSWGNYNKEKRVCTVSVNQWATCQEKQDEEKCGPFWNAEKNHSFTKNRFSNNKLFSRVDICVCVHFHQQIIFSLCSRKWR